MANTVKKAKKIYFLNVKLFCTTLTVAASSFIFGCSQPSLQFVKQASKDISGSLGCTQVKSKIFDAFYAMIDQSQVVPTADSLKIELEKKLDEMSRQVGSELNSKDLDQLKIELGGLVELMLSETLRNPTLNWKEQVQKLIEYEMEDQSDIVTANSSKQISEKVQKIKKLSDSLGVTCQNPGIPASESPNSLHVPPPSNALKAGMMANGLNRVFATAYQSCRVLDLPEMDHSTANVLGIKKDGLHEDGIGGKRYITDLKAVQNSHYYIRGIASESNCKEIRNTPLIYDYGGSPAVTSTTINFFSNAGDGTEALGVDCSAFISSGIAVGGLRYKPGLENKPVYIRQNSRKFISAQESGFSCFENVTVSKNSTLKPGDIVGVIGHVVAVDRLGADPFGLKLLKSEAECSRLNYKNFDFVVSQSSNSKNGIGINKYDAKDYLDESKKMQTAFIEMGKQSCLAYFGNKSIKPKSSEWGFMRHKGTAECLAPRVTIAGESCTRKCF